MMKKEFEFTRGWKYFTAFNAIILTFVAGFLIYSFREFGDSRRWSTMTLVIQDIDHSYFKKKGYYPIADSWEGLVEIMTTEVESDLILWDIAEKKTRNNGYIYRSDGCTAVIGVHLKNERFHKIKRSTVAKIPDDQYQDCTYPSQCIALPTYNIGGGTYQFAVDYEKDSILC